MNKVCIILTLTHDPETRFTSSGTGVCSFYGAYNETYTTGDGTKKTDVSYFECIAWQKTGELIQKHFHKGHKIGITGKLKQERWENDEGKTQSRVKIVVENIDFLQGKREKEEGEPERKSEPARNDFEENPFSDDDIPF
jgi:single-strand DNA-binding protein